MVSKTEVAVHEIHVSVYLPIRLERRQTLPAHMRLAPRTVHVVASLAPLDRRVAPRTLLHVMTLNPSIEQLLVGLQIGAGRALVVLNVAVTTYPDETRGTLEYRVGR